MALFFDHPFTTARREIAQRLHLRAGEASSKARMRRAMPDHICLRLVAGWLVTLTALFALVLTLRWYA